MPKRIPVLPGFSRIKGDSARRYKDPSGQTISRREYENIRLRKEGWESWSDYQQTKKSDDWLRFEGIYADKKGLKRNQIGPTSDFAKRYIDAFKRKGRKDEPEDLYDPDGPLADFLVLTGHRQPDDYWEVGETPTAEK